MGSRVCAIDINDDKTDDESDAEWKSFSACVIMLTLRHLSEKSTLLRVISKSVLVCVRYDDEHCWHQS